VCCWKVVCIGCILKLFYELHAAARVTCRVPMEDGVVLLGPPSHGGWERLGCPERSGAVPAIACTLLSAVAWMYYRAVVWLSCSGRCVAELAGWVGCLAWCFA
jgi:hypothetical protein